MNDKKATFTVFVSKYALTRGIIEMEVRKTSTPGLVCTNDRFVQYFHEKDWSFTKNESIKKAEELRIIRLENLEKQIKRISVIKFD